MGVAARVARRAPTAPARPPAVAAARRAGRPRGRRGGNTRANQALALVREKPGHHDPADRRVAQDRAELPVPRHAQAGGGRSGHSGGPRLAPDGCEVVARLRFA